MKFQFRQRLGAFFCLAAFGIQALSVFGIMRCTDVHTGASRLEWSCTPDSPANCKLPVAGRPVATDGNLVAASGTCWDTPVSVEIGTPVVHQNPRVNAELLIDLFVSGCPSAELTPPCFLARSAHSGSVSFLRAFSYSQSIVLLI